MQPISGASWGTIAGGVGTTVLAPAPVVVRSVVVPGTYVGTVKLHDSATAAGTSGTSSFLTLGLPASSIPFVLPLNVQMRQGLLYEATGTPVLTVTWE